MPNTFNKWSINIENIINLSQNIEASKIEKWSRFKKRKMPRCFLAKQSNTNTLDKRVWASNEGKMSTLGDINCISSKDFFQRDLIKHWIISNSWKGSGPKKEKKGSSSDTWVIHKIEGTRGSFYHKKKKYDENFHFESDIKHKWNREGRLFN